MKLRNIFAAAAATLAIAASCQKENQTPGGAGDKEPMIKVRASLYSFTKATDTAFEESDQIGVNIFKGEESYLYNAKFTYTLGAFEPETAHKWYKDSEIEAVITAAYPYNSESASYTDTESFTVNSDQSEIAGYKASDLLLAKTASRPTENAVTLPFKHALSKISVTLDNKLEEEVENVWFTDLYGTVTYDPKNPFETLAVAGETGTVKAYKSGDNTWVLIVAPQENVTPKLAVTTASGKQYTFTLAEAVSFGSGKLNTANVKVEENSIYTSFTPEISDWTADKELNFSQNEEDVVLPDSGEEEGGSQVVTPEYCRLTVKVNKTIDWFDKYIYSWTGSDTKQSGEWPGTKTSWDKEDGNYYVYYYDFPYSLNGQTINYIVNKGEGGKNNQTNDLTVTLNGDTTVTIEKSDVKVTD